jgi:surface antigen
MMAEYRGNPPAGPLSSLACFLAALLSGLAALAGASLAAEDPRDAAVVAAMVKQTLEFERTGSDLPWSNLETGSRGVIRVERTYYLDSDTPCRDYVRTTHRPDGGRITARGTGCRMGDGRWFLDEALGTEAAPASKAPPATAKAPEGRKDETAPVPTAPPMAEVPREAPMAEVPAPPALTGGDEAEAKIWGKPAGEATAEVGAPAPPPVKPKVRAPEYTLPSRSAL